MAAPAKAKSKRKLILGIVAVAIIVVAITPIAYARSFNVPVAVARFNSTTGTNNAWGLNVTIQIITSWEWFFSTRTQGMVRTSDNNTSSNGGTTNITISMKLYTPSNQTIDLGQTNISGGIGGRQHTIYLSVDQGVHANGNYRLDVTFTANVVLFGGVVELPYSHTLSSNFVISGQ
jgi:hypothetical protein